MAASKGGRPRKQIWTVHGKKHTRLQIQNLICELIATTSAGVSRIVKDKKGFPSYTVVKEWLADDSEFTAKYARAKEDQADLMVDDKPRKASVNRKTKEENDKFVGENVQRSRLRVDARKWAAGKLRPKKYSDKVDLNVQAVTREMNNEEFSEWLGRYGPDAV